MISKALMWLSAGVLCVELATASANAASVQSLAKSNWNCSAQLLPDYTPKTNEPDVGEGVTYLYVGDQDLHENYAAEALLRAPLDGKRGWYFTSIRLGSLKERNAFIQIGISRWERFGYKPHVAVAWGMPHSTSSGYKDTGIMLDAGMSHQVGIAVHGGRVMLMVDGRTVCSVNAPAVLSAEEPKYFQIRTETSAVARNTEASASQLRLKRDSDPVVRPYATNCVLHRNGIFWEAVAPGLFKAHGAFYPNEATFFTGIDPATPPKCVS